MDGSRRRWWALVGVSLATFMTYIDNNVVNVALPSIQRDLHLSISGLEWIVSAYILVFSGLMLVGGRLADVYGRRRLFISGLAVFTLASFLAGIATSPEMLISARVLQGVGAAMSMPSTLAIISAIFPDPKERTQAVGIWAAVSALALALGPFTGGFISQRWHWGWIFLINVPVGIATIAITAASLTDSREGVRRRLDLPGLATSAVALFAVTYALIEGHNRGWSSMPILGSFALSAVALAVFLLIESRSAEPMVDLSIFRSRVFSGGTSALGLWGFGVMGIYFFTAMYLQNVLGFSPTTAGAAFVPMALSMAATAPLAPLAVGRLGLHRTVALGTAIIVAALLDISTVGEHGHFIDLMPAFVAFGIGSSFAMMPITDAVIGTLPPGKASAASGIINAARELSGLLGVTIIGAILTSRAAAASRSGAAPLHAFLEGYQLAIVIAAAIVAIGIPTAWITLRLPRTPAEPVDVTPVDTPVPIA